MPTMTSRQRVLAALKRQQPDRVPYCEFAIDRVLADKLMGWTQDAARHIDLDARNYTIAERQQLADRLGMDNLTVSLRAQVYAKRMAGQDGRLFYGDGLITSEADLDMLKLPDPGDDELYAECEELVKNKGDRAACFSTRIGVFPAMLSMGIETFSIALYENRRFVETVLDAYFGWAEVVAERVCRMGFDVFVSTDDHAFKSGPYLSPAIFREVVMPHYRRVAKKITIPWVMHSDGNLMLILEDLLSLGISGLHPIEKGAMDIRRMKRDYGRRICLLGNVDLNILGLGTPADVEAEVRDLIRDIAPGGGYIVSSGNSLASYLQPENVLAMARAVKTYGRYP
jgi:uroporphyrinogen decarboxylase